MKLRFTPLAAAKLEDVLAYIAERSPGGAGRIQARIEATLDLLTDHPMSGRPTRKPRLRRVVTTPYPYLIFYEVTVDEVIVVGVRHGARRPRSMPGG